MKKIKHKVMAYIMCHNYLLVFRQPEAPEAGIQVPAGTIEEYESPEDAVRREAYKETGLDYLSLNCFLGEQIRDMADFGGTEVHHRYFYHLQCHKDPPKFWQHEEYYNSNNTMQKPIIFELFWILLPCTISLLIADHGIMLPQLLKILSLENS